MDAEYMRNFGFYRGQSRTSKRLTLDHKVGQCEFLPVKEPWQTWAINNAMTELVLGWSVPVIRPEALVVSKLKAMERNLSRVMKDHLTFCLCWRTARWTSVRFESGCPPKRKSGLTTCWPLFSRTRSG